MKTLFLNLGFTEVGEVVNGHRAVMNAKHGCGLKSTVVHLWLPSRMIIGLVKIALQ